MRKLTALLLLAFMLFSSVIGQIPTTSTVENNEANIEAATDAEPVGNGQMTAADVEAFLDGIVPLQLAQQDISGAVVSIVKDGKLLFAKGYGYADAANKNTVVPDKTLFRPGSISKLFTWTAVMQLQGQGKLDLDKNVNEYLDFKIPEAFGKPITLKNIMTHTAGFEEQLKDLFGGEKSPNLGDYVKIIFRIAYFRPEKFRLIQIMQPHLRATSSNGFRSKL